MSQIDYSNLRAEIELEREWRESEMRVLKNIISSIPDEIQRKIARKALVVMLYSHFEGQSKSIFTIYVNAINNLGFTVSQAHSALAAASLSELFHALRHPDSKCSHFRNSLPNDPKLHKYARDREFMEQAFEFGKQPLFIPPDLVDTESNLKPVVLQKILFQLGFNVDLARPWDGAIQQLLRRRNDIAHGTKRDGISESDYLMLEQAVKDVVDAIVKAICDHCISEEYLASSSPHGLGGM